MNREETLNVIRKVYPDITLRAYEALLDILDIPTKEGDKSYYPIPAREGDKVVLGLPGYKIVIEPTGRAYVAIPFSNNRDHRRSLLKCISRYSEEVLEKP